MSGSRSAGWPARSTGRTTFVFSVTASATRAGSMFRSSSRTSTKTGVAPEWTITLAVAGHVIGVVITSSPGPTPSATSDRCSAAVPEASASTCSAPRYSCMRSSSFAAFGPLVSQPERRVSVTAAISSSPIAGGWKPSMVGRLDESFDIDLEPNDRLRAVGAFERLLAAVSDGQDRAGPIRAAPQLAEAVSRTPIDADSPDPLQREGLLDAGHLAELPGRRHEEAHAPAADPGDRRQRRRRNLLPERCRKRRAVEVDAEGDAAQLRVVTAAQPRCELAPARAVRPDEHLRVARAVLDAHGACREGGRLDNRSDLLRLELARPGVRERNAESR